MTLKSRGKLLLITITPLLLITLLITGIFYWNGLNALKTQAQDYRTELITTHENSLKANLRMGRTAIKALYESDVNGSNKEKAKAILKDMRFADDGYFFAYNSQGVNTLHAIKPQLEGKNLLSLKDSNGVSVIAGLIKASTKGDGYLYFSWHKPSIDAQAPKLGYAEYLSKWDWVLGTGVYIDDVDSQVTAYIKKRKTQISNDTTYAIILSMIGLIITTFIIGIIVTKALKPLKNMVENLHDIAQGGGDLTNCSGTLNLVT